MKLLRFLQLLLLIIFVNTGFFSQTTNGARTKSSCSAKFKIVAEGESFAKPVGLAVDVVIKSKYFTKDCLCSFARQINAMYQQHDLIAISLFDSAEDQVGWFHDYITTQRRVDRRRGYYNIDRKAGTDIFKYSSQKGNPLDEMRIDCAPISEQ